MTLPGTIAGETVTVIDAPLVDDTTGANYGNPYLDWSAATRTDVDGCSVQPLPVPEQVDPSRDAVTTRYLLVAPDGTELDALNRVEWRGQTFEVDGAPLIFAGTPLDHVEAILSQVRG